jgi:hypothetical protein
MKTFVLLISLLRNSQAAYFHLAKNASSLGFELSILKLSNSLTPMPGPKVYITPLPAILPADKLKHEKN